MSASSVELGRSPVRCGHRYLAYFLSVTPCFFCHLFFFSLLAFTRMPLLAFTRTPCMTLSVGQVEKRAHHGLCASASDNWEYKQTNANLGDTHRNSNVAAAQIATTIAIEVTQSSSQTATTCPGALQPQTPMVFNWTQCNSEGGAGNCAICNGQGGHLPCDQVRSL